MRFPVVLFDLDGTLIDSGPMILASFRHATSTVLAVDLPDEVLLAGVGGSSLEEQMTVLEPTRTAELVAAYRKHNEPLHDALQPCTGLPDLLVELHAEGRRLGIVTAKRHRTVALAFETLPLRHVFGAVVAQDDVARGKPHPDGILLALDRLDGTPEQATYIGDSPYDVGAAKAAGVYAIAVTWGGIHSLEALEEAEPDAIVDSADELRAML